MKQLLKSLVPAWLWERARLWRIQQRVNTYPRYWVSHRYGASNFEVLIADEMSAAWYDLDWEEPHEITLLRRGRLQPGSRVFDLGAHQAVVAMMLGRAVGPTGEVLAVEGMRHNVEVARENVTRNAMGQVSILHAAVSDAPGQIRFFEGLNGSIAKHGAGVLVDALTIDQLAERHGQPDVVFLDVEGAEHAALKGANKTLGAGCDCFIEVHVGCGLEDSGSSAGEVVAQFDPSEYALLVLDLEADTAAPYEIGQPLPTKRFGLIATTR